MSEEIENQDSTASAGEQSAASRRRLLKLGAATVPAIVSLKGGAALANTGISMGCSVTITAAEARIIENDDTVNTDRFLSNEQVKALLMNDGPATGLPMDHIQDYLDHLTGLGTAGSGASCVMSVEMAHVRQA